MKLKLFPTCKFPTSVIIFLLTLSCTVQSFAELPHDIIQESKILYQMENKFHGKCINSDWEGIYSFQHPTYKKHVSLAEFKFFDGRIAYNYRTNRRSRVSGGYAVPAMRYILANQEKKDILGYPSKRKYHMTTNPFVNIKAFTVEKISLAKSKRFAKVSTLFKGTMLLQPGLVRAHMMIPFTKTMETYWEKIDGKWVITLLKDPAHLSGNKYFHFIPNDSSAWKSMEFIDIDVNQLGKEKS